MSDKLTQEFDLYYGENKNFTETFKDRSQTIQTDKTLSRVGKHEQTTLLTAEHVTNVDGLHDRFKKEFGGRVGTIGDVVNGTKKDPVLDSIKRRFGLGENLNSDETNRLLLHEMREQKSLTQKSNFQGMLYTSPLEQVRKTVQSLSDAGDSVKLEWVKEIADLKGEDTLSKTIGAQIEGVKDSKLSDEQKNLKAIGLRIEKEMKLFDYSIQRAKKGDFVDVRNDEVQ